MKFKNYKKRIVAISTLSLCSTIAFSGSNSIINKQMSSKQNKKDSSQSKTTIVQDILNKDISMKNNNFILAKDLINWSVRHYTTLWNNGGQKTLGYLNAFNINKDLNFKVDDDLLLKLIGEINNDENPFGKKVGEQTKYLKSDKFFITEKTKLDPKFNSVYGETHAKNCSWSGNFDWKVFLLSSFKQMKSTENQIGGQYVMDYKFETNLLNHIEDFHIYNQGFDWNYFSGFDYTISTEKNLDNKKESNTFNSDFSIDLFSSKNSIDIIKTFLSINLPYLENNPNNESGIWNKEDLIKNNYESIFKFSDDLKLLKFISDYIKSNNGKEFINDNEMNNFQDRLIKSKIIKQKNDNQKYSINELSLLYERIIGWFKNNEIIANISIDGSEGKDYIIWNGNSLLNEYDFFNIHSNKNTLNIKINHIENKLKSFDSKVISGFLKTSDVFGEYTLNYRNDFTENNINVENSFDKCIPIELDTNVEDILMNDGQNVSFVKTADNYLALKIKENLNKKIGNNLFNSIEAFDYSKNTFYNIDDVLKDFNIFENKELINHNPSNNNGIFYVVATIPKWNTIDSVNNFNGDFRIEDKIRFINNINKNSLNIKEFIVNDEQDTNGYFLIKLRTNKTNYTKNFNDYLNILNNFNIMFKINYIEKNNNDFFTNDQSKKFHSIEISNTTEINGITHDNIDGSFIEKEVWTEIKKDPNNIFNYLDFIFNELNIEYENEINNEFIRNKILEIKNSIKLNEVSIEGLNILNIVILSVTIFITIGLGGIFFYKYKKNKLKNDNKNKNKKCLE